MKKSFFILIIFFTFCITKSSYGNFDQCITYFNEGDFNSSFNECKYLALQGDNKAINHLAYMFYTGQGVKQNITISIALYKIAAKNNNAKAQYNLGVFISRGVGITKNLLDAAFWFTLSSLNKYENSINELNLILPKLSSLEKDELNIRIDKWNISKGRKIIGIIEKPPKFIPSNLKLSGFGTGFFIKPSSMITNHHVIDNCKAITIIINNKRVVAKIINSDKNLDLALLDIKHTNKYFVKFEDNNLEQGEEIIVVGFPLPDMLNTNAKVTDGIVSSLYGIKDDPDRITHTAPTQPGNSGGPVFSEKGTVIAVVVSTYTHEDIMKELGGYIPQNINFAIKGSKVKNFIKKSNYNYASLYGKKDYKPKEIIKLGNLTTKMVECWK